MHHEFGIVTGQVCLGCHVHYVLGCASGGANELVGLFIGREPMRLDGLKFARGSREDFAFQAPKTGRNPIWVTREDCFRGGGALTRDQELCDEIDVPDDHRRMDQPADFGLRRFIGAVKWRCLNRSHPALRGFLSRSLDRVSDNSRLIVG
jgi:hypothetical protein